MLSREVGRGARLSNHLPKDDGHPELGKVRFQSFSIWNQQCRWRMKAKVIGLETVKGIYVESYIQQLFADRIGGSNYGENTAIYKFEKIKRAKAAAKAAHPNRELIDMGVGATRRTGPPAVVEILSREAGKSENRFYTDNGNPRI